MAERPDRDPVEEYWSKLINPSDRVDDGALGKARQATEPGMANLLEALNDARRILDDDSTVEGDAAESTGAKSAIAYAGAVDVGTHVDGYVLKRMLGQGGMAVVYEAIQVALGRDVALKFIRSGPLASHSDVARFQSEVKTMASLSHPGIVAVYDTGIWQGHHYFSMELVDGLTITEALRDGPIDPRRAVKLARLISEAVGFAHENGILHRDLKPSNVIIDESSDLPRVADFGLAKLLTSREGADDLTESGAMVGTPSYMSPEQALGKNRLVSPASDVYSIGAVLYEMLVGRPPFRAATSVETLRQVVDAVPVPLRQLNPALHRDLETICARCLEKDPDKRYDSATQVAAELQRFEHGQPIIARPLGPIQRTVKWCRRNPRVAGLAALSAILLLTLGVGSLFSAMRLSREKQKAEDARVNALHDRTVAIETLSKLVNSFYDDLKANAATVKAREKVADAVLEGLNAITKIQGDRVSQRTAMVAHQRIGDLLRLQGKNDEAKTHLDKAVAIARRLHDELPDDLPALEDLAIALDRTVVHEILIGNSTAAIEIQAEAKSLFQQLVDADPTNLVLANRLVLSSTRDIDLLWVAQDVAGAVKSGRDILPAVERISELGKDSPKSLLTIGSFYSRFGRAHLESGDPATGYRFFRRARASVVRALELEPGNAQAKRELITNDRMTGVLLAQAGRARKAVEELQNVLSAVQEMAADDPDNRELRLEVANTWVLLGKPLKNSGQLEQSIESYDSATSIYRKMQEHSPGLAMLRLLLCQALSERGDVFLRQGKLEDALADFEASHDQLTNQDQAAITPAMQYSADIAAAFRDACRLRVGSDTDKIAENLRESSIGLAVTGWLLEYAKDATDDLVPKALGEKMEAWSGQSVQLATVGDVIAYLKDNPGPLVGMDYALDSDGMRIYAKIARNAANSDQPIVRAASEQLVDVAVKRAESFSVNYPAQATAAIFAEFDLEWLRQTEQFKNSGISGPNLENAAERKEQP